MQVAGGAVLDLESQSSSKAGTSCENVGVCLARVALFLTWKQSKAPAEDVQQRAAVVRYVLER
jgi:hypothetical protein